MCFRPADHPINSSDDAVRILLPSDPRDRGRQARLTLQILYALVSLVVVSAFVKAAGTDPVATRAIGFVPARAVVSSAIAHRPSRVLLLVFPFPPQDPPDPDALFCNLCACDVAKGSKHCRVRQVRPALRPPLQVAQQLRGRQELPLLLRPRLRRLRTGARAARRGRLLLHWALTDKRGANERSPRIDIPPR